MLGIWLGVALVNISGYQPIAEQTCAAQPGVLSGAAPCRPFLRPGGAISFPS
jgi:hypothetical protein